MAKGFVTFQMKLRGEEPPVPLGPLSSLPNNKAGSYWDQLMETPVNSVSHGLLNRGFVWSSSPQGAAFWRKFYRELQSRNAGREPVYDPDFQKALDYIEDWQRQWRER
jgi:hypothetical protein